MTTVEKRPPTREDNTLERMIGLTGHLRRVAAVTEAASKTPQRLYPLRFHPVQARLREEDFRFKVIPAGRRSGKTELFKRKLITSALSAYTPWSDPRYFAGAPTRDQAKRIYWTDLKAMMPPTMLRGTPRETDLVINLINGAELCVVGMDKPERIEGSPWDGGGLDEYANMKEKAFPENVRPALSDRNGWCWLLGVPEGRNHYYKLYRYALSGTDPEWMGYTWKSADILPSAEVESARRSLDPLTFQQEYEASFVNFEGRAYYPFLEETHCVRLKHLYNDAAALCFAFDFNVEPGVAAVLQELPLPGQFRRDKSGAALLDQPIVGTAVIGEVHIPRNSNTPAVCARLVKDWGAHKGIVKLYGDATGGARGTAKVEGSDWDLIKRAMREAFGDRVYPMVRRANPKERVRINALNTRLRNGAEEQWLMVDAAAAPHVVEDLEGVTLLEGGSGEIDKKADPALTHISDALGYYVEREFPLPDRNAEVEELDL